MGHVREAGRCQRQEGGPKLTTHDPTPHNMAMIVIYKDDLHYLQRAGRRVKKKEIDLLHDIIEKHRRPGAAASEGGRKPHDSTKDEDQHRNPLEEKHVVNAFRGHVFKNTHQEGPGQ